MQLPGNEGHMSGFGHLGEDGQTAGDVAFVVTMTLLTTLAFFGVLHLFVEGKGVTWDGKEKKKKGTFRPGG